MIRVLWPIAVITFKEGLRNRVIYGITLLSIMLLAANVLICNMVLQDVGKVAVDMALSTVSFSGLLLVLFVGINLMAKDLERHTIYMVLARPISRVQYLLGKYLGMVFLLLTSSGVLGGAAIGSIYLIKMSAADYFPRFSLGMTIVALCFILLMLLLLTAISFLFSSFASTSFVSFVLTLAVYIIGMSIGSVRELISAQDVVGIEISRITATLVDVAYYVFPNLSLFDLKSQAAHNLPIEWSHHLWVLGYWFFYSFLIIFVSSLVFSRKEFP
jgi:ABC-type transport system involved in multi-copper enzyme maturation permease subunit